MQVNFFPPKVAVEPALEQIVPAFGDAAKIGEEIAAKRATETVKTNLFRT